MTPRNTSWVGVALRVGPTLCRRILLEGSRFFFPVVQRTSEMRATTWCHVLFIYPFFFCCLMTTIIYLFIYLFVATFDATQQHHLSNGGETDSFLPPSPLVFSTPKILMINIRFIVP